MSVGPARSQTSHLHLAHVAQPATASDPPLQLATARAELAAAHHLAAAQAEQLAREAGELGRLHLELACLQGECWWLGRWSPVEFAS